MKIFDNFLNNDDFDHLCNVVFSNNFPWYFNNCKTDTDADNLNNFQFTHLVSENDNNNSSTFDLLDIFKIKLKINSIVRAKFNLTTKTSKIFKFPLHLDDNNKNTKVAIFYLNDNNGYTYFSDGKKCKSKSNRLLTFNGNIFHSGTTSTNTKKRVVLNICYT